MRVAPGSEPAKVLAADLAFFEHPLCFASLGSFQLVVRESFDQFALRAGLGVFSGHPYTKGRNLSGRACHSPGGRVRAHYRRGTQGVHRHSGRTRFVAAASQLVAGFLRTAELLAGYREHRAQTR